MIPLFKPVYNTEKILAELRSVFDTGWTGLGGKTAEFEKVIADYIGARYCVSLNSCTSALHLAVKSLKLSPGSKVLTTPLTFVSTNHAILYEGLTPVFCDVEKTTGVIDPMLVFDYCVKNSVSAIMVVHYGGYSCDMDSINSIRDTNEIPVIEDCAHAFGSKYQGKYIGSGNNIYCFSFQAVKNLSMGDGGALVTNDESLNTEIRKLRWMGIDRSSFDRSTSSGYAWEYTIDRLGYKYYMNDISATIGLCNLELVASQNARRKQIADYYRDNLKAELPIYSNDRESSYHIYPVFTKNRNEKMVQLNSNGILCGMHYALNCDFNIYKEYERINDCKNARWFADHEITLPMSPTLTDSEVEKVVEVFNK